MSDNKNQVTTKTKYNTNDRFVFSITKNGVKLIDVQSNKSYDCKLQPYTRVGKDGNRIQCCQIAFDSAKVGCENKGVIQLPKVLNKLNDERWFSSNLNNRKSSNSQSATDYLAMLFN